MVLLIACANVMALQLARAATRREELAVRAALGASRGRLMSQLLSESLLLASMGGVLALLLSAWGTQALLALPSVDIPRADEIRVDGMVVAFTTLLALAATLLVGLAPAIQAARGAVSGALRDGGRGSAGTRSGTRLRSALVIGEIATAVMLLAGAGVLVRSLVQLISVDPGFNARGATTFRVALPETAFPGSDGARTLFAQLTERLGALPGVESVGATSRLPLASSLFTSRFLAEGWPEPAPGERGAVIAVRVVTPEYFGTMQIPVRRGRGIEPADREGSLPVVVINEAAARRYFPREDPIGKRLTWFSYDAVEGPPRTIVGVVGDLRHVSLESEPEPEVYFAHAQVPLRSMSVVIRTTGDPFALAPSIRQELRAIAPTLPAPRVATLESVVADSVARPRMVASMLALFAATALVLASIGIFGLLSYSVAQRTREIGIRLALGARASEVVRMFVLRAARLVGTGLVIGLAGAYALTRSLRSLLFGVSPSDPATLVAVVLLLALSALVATLIPARRAAAVDPVLALRHQ